MSAIKIFISYKSEDYSESYRLKKALEKEGFFCWMAPDSIPGGSSYAKEIPKAIQKSDVFVLVFSRKTERSKWIPRELDLAINKNKTIQPFFIEDCPLNDEFGFYLSNVQRYAAWENRNKALQDMVRRIRKESPGPGGNPPDPSGLRKWLKKHGRKIVAAVSAVLLLLALNRHSVLPDTDDASVNISDPVLLNAICSELDITGEELTTDVAASVKTLDLSRKEEEEKISKLDGISAFSNLEELYLADHNISDISELENLRSLKKINLESNRIEDLSPLKGLNELEWIDLNDNRNIEKIDPLVTHTKVIMLDLRSNHVSDISGISGMVSLKKLYLSRNQIEDISPVSGLHNLTYLSFDSNRVSDIDCLSFLTGLHTLTMNSNKITDISALAALQELRHLEIAGNDNIADFSPLDQLPDSCEIERSDLSKKGDS